MYRHICKILVIAGLYNTTPVDKAEKVLGVCVRDTSENQKSEVTTWSSYFQTKFITKWFHVLRNQTRSVQAKLFPFPAFLHIQCFLFIAWPILDVQKWQQTSYTHTHARAHIHTHTRTTYTSPSPLSSTTTTHIVVCLNFR